MIEYWLWSHFKSAEDAMKSSHLLVNRGIYMHISQQCNAGSSEMAFERSADWEHLEGLQSAKYMIDDSDYTESSCKRCN
jgi:hypothetical protein